MSKEDSKIISWLYMVEISGDNQASEKLKRGVSESLMEMSRRNDLEKLTRTYAEVQKEQVQKFYWE